MLSRLQGDHLNRKFQSNQGTFRVPHSLTNSITHHSEVEPVSTTRQWFRSASHRNGSYNKLLVHGCKLTSLRMPDSSRNETVVTVVVTTKP